MSPKKPPTILDFVGSAGRPGLFPEFADPSWLAWRSILAAAFGLVPEDADLVRRVTGRDTLPATCAREFYLVLGRGAGKSRAAAVLACYFGCGRTYTRVVGEFIYVQVLAPDRRQAAITHRYILGLLRSVKALAALIVNETLGSVELSTGVVIETTTADYRTVRGRSVACAIVEEGAFLPTDDSATPDTELLRALRPALARVPGSMLVFGSSPYARRGELYRAWRQHFGKDGDTLVVQADTFTMNPTFDKRAIEIAYRDDPTSAAAEHGAQFRSDVESFLSREAVEACVVPGRLELPLMSNTQPRPFFDFAGGSGGSGGSGGDAAAMGVAWLVDGRVVLGCVREVRPPFSPERVCADFAAVCKAYGCSTATADRWGGQFPAEQMAKHGIVVEFSAKPKSDLYREFLSLANSGRVELLDLPRLITQLEGLERRTARGGKDSIDHSPGGHDDVANAAVGACVLAGLYSSEGAVWDDYYRQELARLKGERGEGPGAVTITDLDGRVWTSPPGGYLDGKAQGTLPE